jgi:hypothetical protein
MIGKNAGNCLYDQRKYFDKIMHTWRADDVDGNNSNADKSPKIVSKIFANDDKCDVVSIFEEQITKKTVKKEYRLEKLKRKFAQCYMQSAWDDFAFINNLKHDKVLSSSNQNAESFDIVNRSIDDCVTKTSILIVS